MSSVMHELAFSQWAHDVRNALSTIALYVDTLERPESPHSVRTVANTQALLAKVATMCSSAAKHSHDGVPRAPFDLMQTVAQVRELVETILPPGVSLDVEEAGPTMVVADALDVFRILFNLLHNAATVARQTGKLSRIHLAIARTEGTAHIAVSDDGPGLPEAVRAQLFWGGPSQTGESGHGLAIARALAERNGGTLRLADSRRGATFVVDVPLHEPAADRIAILFQARERRALTAA